MLFGTCNCNWNGSPISRRGLLCSGGAGFVTALIGTLASSSRTAQAQALASKPPEVDSLAVRIVTDNQIIKFIPTEKREPLAHDGGRAGRCGRSCFYHRQNRANRFRDAATTEPREGRRRQRFRMFPGEGFVGKKYRRLHSR